MRVHNVHERRLRATAAQLGALIDSLASADDRLWPRDRWPAMRFDGGLREGARGGHGPIRYDVAEHAPSRRVTFRFTDPPGLVGVHRWEVEDVGEGEAVLRHVVEARAERLMVVQWPVVLRPLHDALIEDALDHAQAAVEGMPYRPRRWSPWVRLLRQVMSAGRGGAAPRPSAT